MESLKKSHRDKSSSHHTSKQKHKQEKHSLPNSTSKSLLLKNVNGNSSVKDSTKSSPSLYTYEKKVTQRKYLDYDPDIDVSEGYNPECPELFPTGKTLKLKKSDSQMVDPSAAKSSQKRKLKSEEQTESQFKHKKIKSEYSKFDNNIFPIKSPEKKDKHDGHRDKNKDKKSELLNVKKECSAEIHSNGVDIQKHKSSSAKKKLKNKDCHENGSVKSDKLKPKLKINASVEFTSSEVRFEDCLGLNDIVPLKKKKSSKSQSAVKKTSDTIQDNKKSCASSSKVKDVKFSDGATQSFKEKLHVPKPSMKLDNVDIFSSLPYTQSYHMPPESFDFYTPKKKEILTEEDAIRFTSSRREKTAVYSGKKSYFTEVPSLFEICTRILIENIDAIEYMGEVPYFLIKPVLERCTPTQLFQIEDFNPYLLESTHELWETHCRRDYRLLTPEENETWRELYLRARDEREKKLKRISANISASMSKSNPVRQVKLAFVDSIAKPPRDVARKQAKNGTARSASSAKNSSSSKEISKVSGSSSAETLKPSGSSSTEASKVIASSSKDKPSSAKIAASSSVALKKPKVAPLMAKTLKSMKHFYRR